MLLILKSIFTDDIYILIAALCTSVCWYKSLTIAHQLEKPILEWRLSRIDDFPQSKHGTLTICYSLFITLISIFPLLGMFGTVLALLSLDLASGNMDLLKENFFSALTSTAWGIIFSVIFKIINSFSSSYIETQLEDGKAVAYEIECLKNKISGDNREK